MRFREWALPIAVALVRPADETGTRLVGDTHTELEPLSGQAFRGGIFVGRFRVV